MTGVALRCADVPATAAASARATRRLAFGPPAAMSNTVQSSNWTRIGAFVAPLVSCARSPTFPATWSPLVLSVTLVVHELMPGDD